MKKIYENIYCKGTKIGRDVIATLIKHGAKNTKKLNGTDEDSIYYIAPDNVISMSPKKSSFTDMIKDLYLYREIKPELLNN